MNSSQNDKKQTAPEIETLPPSGTTTLAADPPTSRLTRRALLSRGLALTGAIAAGDFAYETNAITVTRHTLPMPGLKQPCRLVQISDLHRSWCVAESFIERVVTQTNALKPDVIALTGDFVTSHSDYIGSCLNALRPLQAPLGLFAVLGNHDYAADDLRGGHPITEALTAQGIHVLTNRSERLDNNLRLVGVDDYRFGNPQPAEAFRKMVKGEAVLAMSHSPFIFESLCAYDCVTLVGHTHGGQVNIPGLTSHLIGSKQRYQHGWYKEPTGPGRMYVSRGLGVVGIPFRFHSPPEIAVFDLTPI
jgi:predicted MPP superfamily phosphohydrolase